MPTKPMPPGRIVYVCHNCGLVLYYYALGENVNEKYAGIPDARRVSKIHGGRCPRCGAPLSPRPLAIEIKRLQADAGVSMGSQSSHATSTAEATG